VFKPSNSDTAVKLSFEFELIKYVPPGWKSTPYPAQSAYALDAKGAATVMAPSAEKRGASILRDGGIAANKTWTEAEDRMKSTTLHGLVQLGEAGKGKEILR